MYHVAPACHTSVARPLLTGLLAISTIATVCGSLLGVSLFRQEAETQRRRDLAAYAEERTKYEQALFRDLWARHADASRTLQDGSESRPIRQRPAQSLSAIFLGGQMGRAAPPTNWRPGTRKVASAA